ncbi:DUF1254 domain-containing protein [Mycetocola tolaasinivorans]|uniref:DUF1254 domain-containing protein n=1 Tax=Mycetocola tolaasinivorans TaxID=76635 RepID=A0A3L7AC21_9MICO|nr:DUF1254 domain-containing protein [Mycetocola tolaasinivorans]RLP77268.1 DUF1254 domain-containing protein [Mycetocola tolaasinivorans]
MTAQPAPSPYLFHYPLVENLRQVTRYLTTGVGSNPAAAANSFSHARTLAGPQDTFVTINNDTVYSMAQLDLSAGPIRLDTPDLGDRYYVLQFVDAWTNNIAYIGTRATGNAAGSFLIVPPGWSGSTDLPVVHASTDIVSIVGRFACTGPDDLPAVHALQDATVLTSLDPSGTDRGIPDVGSAETEAELFWAQAEAWAARFPGPEADAALAAGFPLPAAADREADFAAGVADLATATTTAPTPFHGGWGVGLHLFDYNVHVLGLGTDADPRWLTTDPERRILDRAISCRLGLWGNHAYEAVYAQAFTDIAGAPLIGDHTYRITFTELPPVGAFWSITLYDIPRYFLVDNPIDRYSIGDRTAGLQYEEDGTLVLTLAHGAPTDARERANWLPTPAEAFRLVMRFYIPGDSILEETYVYPEVRRVPVA